MTEINLWFHGFTVRYNGTDYKRASDDRTADGIGNAIALADMFASAPGAAFAVIKRTPRARNILATVCATDADAGALDHSWREDTALGNRIAYHDERLAAWARLRAFLEPGATVYTVLRSVSRSGMMRAIDVYALATDDRDGKPYHAYLSHSAGILLGYGFTDAGALRVGGCGMDMGFHVAHSLSYALHGPQTIGADAEQSDRDGRPFAPRPDAFRAGYSLRHEWI